MSTDSSKVSQETFDKLITRALEIDEQGKQRIDIARAREIARELGISDEAWETALREHASATPARHPATAPPRPPREPLVSVASAATVGAALFAGWVGGATSEWISGWDVFTGATMVAASLALVLHRRHKSGLITQARLALFWLSVPIGIGLGFGQFHSDPMFFAAFSWAGSALAAFGLPRLLRRFRSPSPPSIAPTT